MIMEKHRKSRKLAFIMLAVIFLNSVLTLKLRNYQRHQNLNLLRSRLKSESNKEIFDNIEEKSIDRKWIPDFAEEIGEEVLTEVLKEARKTFDLKVILQQIFDEEKAGNKNIL